MGQILDNLERILFEILPNKRYIVSLWQTNTQSYLTDFAATDEAFSLTVLHKYNQSLKTTIGCFMREASKDGENNTPFAIY